MFLSIFTFVSSTNVLKIFYYYKMAIPFHLGFYPSSQIHRLSVLGTENSCYFHAVLSAFNPTYKENPDVTFKTQMARTLRNLLAEKLDSYNVDGKKIYDLLSQGTFRSYSEAVPEYSLPEMLNILKGNEPVDHRFQELLCDVIDIDIYILNSATRDVYHVTNEKIYIKDRKSVVLLYEPGHYSLIGKFENGEMITLFNPDHDFIKSIRQRIFTES